MDPIADNHKLGDLRVSKDSLIEEVAESVLSQAASIGVVDSSGKLIGSLDHLKVIKVLFGDKYTKTEGS